MGSVANMILYIITATLEVMITKWGVHYIGRQMSAAPKVPSRAHRHAFGFVSLNVCCLLSCLNCPVSAKGKSKLLVMLTHWSKVTC